MVFHGCLGSILSQIRLEGTPKVYCRHETLLRLICLQSGDPTQSASEFLSLKGKAQTPAHCLLMLLAPCPVFGQAAQI
jgi:hypothetical protein